MPRIKNRGEQTTMEIKKFYETIGSDYYDVAKRMGSEKLVVHFVGRFMEDKTYMMLEEAFRTAHMLKGVCSNLGFGRLQNAASELTEVLRKGTFEGSEPLFENVRAEYNRVVDTWKCG